MEAETVLFTLKTVKEQNYNHPIYKYSYLFKLLHSPKPVQDSCFFLCELLLRFAHDKMAVFQKQIYEKSL